jgi:hypothetical protein
MTTTDTSRDPRAPAPRRGRAWRRGGLGAAAVTVLIGCAALVAVLTRPGNAVRDSGTSYPLRSAAVVVTTPADGVDLVLEPGSAGRLSVESRLVFGYGSPPSVATSWDGRTLRLGLRCPRRPSGRGCHARYTVRVPVGTAVAASTTAGDVTAGGLTGDLRLATGAGDITVTGARGPLWARTSAGDIRASALRSPTAELTTSTGDVVAAFAAAPTRLDATTHAGDVRLDLPATATYRVQAETSTGVREVTVRQAPGATHVVTAYTDVGDLDIE